MVLKEKVAGFDITSSCPKQMLNGPCGGMKDGMCEVSGPCVWVKIYARLKAENNLGDFTRIRLPRYNE